MSKLFVIRNQNNLYLSKQNEWLDGNDVKPLFKTPHHDIALNTLIEHNSKDITLRGDILSVESTEKGLPIVEVLAQPQLTLETLAPSAQEPEPQAENQHEQTDS